MFQHRIEEFSSEYLLSDAHPLGHITDYVIKIEFQMRRSPHAHCLLWVKDAPNIDKDPDDVVCAFTDKYITAVIPPIASENEHHSKLMENLQKHTHSDYSHRNRSCHFGFPKPPTTKTLISRQPIDENDENYRKCKISATDCAKHTDNSRHTPYLHTTLPARHQLGCGDIYRCFEDFKKRSKCHFATKPTRCFDKCMQT